MAISESNESTRAVEINKEVPVGEFIETLPDRTTCDVTFRGTPEQFIIEIERNHRWTIEGAGSTAELTGVFGGGNPEKPTEVPTWIARVLETMDVTEVSVQTLTHDTEQYH